MSVSIPAIKDVLKPYLDASGDLLKPVELTEKIQSLSVGQWNELCVIFFHDAAKTYRPWVFHSLARAAGRAETRLTRRVLAHMAKECIYGHKGWVRSWETSKQLDRVAVSIDPRVWVQRCYTDDAIPDVLRNVLVERILDIKKEFTPSLVMEVQFGGRVECEMHADFLLSLSMELIDHGIYMDHIHAVNPILKAGSPFFNLSNAPGWYDDPKEESANASTDPKEESSCADPVEESAKASAVEATSAANPAKDDVQVDDDTDDEDGGNRAKAATEAKDGGDLASSAARFAAKAGAVHDRYQKMQKMQNMMALLQGFTGQGDAPVQEQPISTELTNLTNRVTILERAVANGGGGGGPLEQVKADLLRKLIDQIDVSALN